VNDQEIPGWVGTAAVAHRAYPYTGGVSTGTISFARGVPAPECLPVSDLADCAKTAIEHDGAAALLYGHTLGYEPLRE
jgi:DNA-binding transcriptional MocR family regulator